MNAMQDWLDRLRSHGPAPTLVEYRRNKALALLSGAGEDIAWAELSRHENGFVREVAVRALCSQRSCEALVALIERLNDWVAQVRELAAAGLDQYLTPAQAPALLFALDGLIALAARQRADHGPTLLAVRGVLQTREVHDQVYAHFLASQGKAARYLFALLLETHVGAPTLLRDALAHRELTVRLAAVSACQALPVAQAVPLLMQAMSRPGAKVRVAVLRALLPLLDDARPVLSTALLDASPSIRSLARWAAPRHGVDARAVLAERLDQDLPGTRQDWLGTLGLAAELNVGLAEQWLTEALHSTWPSVRHGAVRLLGDHRLPALFDALEDPSERVFAAVIARLHQQPWAALNAGLAARLDRDWHQRSAARRQAILHLLPGWQQLAYLLGRLDAEPVMQAFWLGQVEQWCDRQYQIVDPMTPRGERAALLQTLRNLAGAGLLKHERIARIVE